MSLRDPVAVYNARNNMEAHLARNALTAAGVQAFVTEDLSPVGGSLAGLLPEIHKPQVWVERADADRTRPILEEFERRAAELRNASEGAVPRGAPVEVLCEDCGERTSFPAAQRGSVQECPHCGAFLDVGEEPAENFPPSDEEEAREPLVEEEMAALLNRLIRTKKASALDEEEWARLAHTLPDCDWGTAAGWAMVKGWSGEELVRWVRSGELERDPEYRAWLTETFEGEAE